MVTKAYHEVDTESAAASDNLATINGGQDGAIIVLRATNDGRTVVVKNGTDNIVLGGSDFDLDNTLDTIMLIYDAGLNSWQEISRSNNGA